jgi:hypothetical protein
MNPWDHASRVIWPGVDGRVACSAAAVSLILHLSKAARVGIGEHYRGLV